MQIVDWIIILSLLAFIVSVAFYTKVLSKNVADYLAANRCAGRYVISVTEGVGALCVLTFISRFEIFYQAGFTSEWWGTINFPIALIISVSGFVIYRYRQVRSLTLNQFIEIRYSRNLRIVVAILAWISGLLVFGLYPAVGARFFIYFCGLPPAIIVGPIVLSTYVLVMLLLIALSLFFVFIGGQVTILITDFIQGIIMNIVLLTIFIYLVVVFDWNVILETLRNAPEGQSMVDPMDIGDAKKFNVYFYLIAALALFYNQNCTQSLQGFYSSARNSHEARMSKIIGTFRWVISGLLFMMLPLCAYVFMNHENYATRADSVMQKLSLITDEYLRRQLTVSVALAEIFPPGLMGAFTAIMLFALITTFDTQLLAWGSIFIQDIVLPLKKKDFSPKKHMMMLRISILFVASFIFCFSYFYKQTTEIVFFFALSGSIYFGGIGAIMIGGLYWKKGTTQGAWASMITGTVMGLTGFIATHSGVLPESITGNVVFFFTIIASISAYVSVSLLTYKTPFNLEKMLHRGKYAIKEDDANVTLKELSRGLKAFGFTKEFTKSDKILYTGSIAWCLLWTVIFIFGTSYSLIFGISFDMWAKFWHIRLWVFFIVGVFLTIWLTYGGTKDVLYMFRHLKGYTRNNLDDGRVVNHHNLADEIKMRNNEDKTVINKASKSPIV